MESPNQLIGLKERNDALRDRARKQYYLDSQAQESRRKGRRQAWVLLFASGAFMGWLGWHVIKWVDLAGLGTWLLNWLD